MICVNFQLLKTELANYGLWGQFQFIVCFLNKVLL